MIDIHADDYAYSINTSKQLIKLIQENKLDSISIMPNMANFDECMELFYEAIPSFSYLPLISVHINLVEGYSLSKGNLISSNGFITTSWGKLFLNSFKPLNRELRNQLSKEIALQINKVDETVKKSIEIAKKNNIPVKQIGLRLDSHVHTHPIPIVWNALNDSIIENNYAVEYIRNPKEPLPPFIKNGFLFKVKFINLIKNRILMLLSGKIDQYSDTHHLPKEYMCGLLFSGQMDERIKGLETDLVCYSNEHDRNIELLFHPGTALENELSQEKNSSFFKDFNSSKNRGIEYQSVKMLK